MAAHGGNWLPPDIADVTLTNPSFVSGVTAHTLVSWLPPYREQSLVVVGDRAKVQNNDSLFAGVESEDEVFCGPASTFIRARNPRAGAERKDAFERTLMRRGATLGANCTIRCGVTIGEHALVGAGAVVTRDVEAHAVMLGNPARQAGWACSCGERLELGVPCGRCGSAWRVEGGALLPA